MIQMYNDLHSQGLEVVGVSNDQDKQELIDYLSQNRAMVWPQLFGPSNSPQHWNAMAEAFQVHAIPTMYVIDRNGLLQTIAVGRGADDQIKRMLSEAADPALADMQPITLAPPKPAIAAKPKIAKPAPTSVAAPAAAQAAPTPPAPIADDPAAKATRALNLARSYISAERFDTARTKLQAIITSWPDTPAAKDAVVVLKEIEGK